MFNYDHTRDNHHAIWNGCLNARQALGEVYNMQPLYNTHNPFLPNTLTTPDLFYKEEIRIGVLWDDDKHELEISESYHEWLRSHRGEEEITPP